MEGNSQKKEILTLGILAIIFFCLYLFLYLNPSVLSLPQIRTEKGTEPAFLILNQPDESVNYFFIRELVLNNRFSFPESLSSLALNQIHPRSATVINGGIAPIGFPGFIVIAAFLLKMLVLIGGEQFFNLLAVVLTPLAAVLTPFFFYGILLRIFDRATAWLAAIFLFFMPAWWYYASRPFQHNTLFVFVIVTLLYCYTIARGKKSCHSRESGNPANTENWIPVFAGMTGMGQPFLIGILFGLAIYARPIEVVWLSALAIIGLICLRHYWSWRQYLAAAVGVVLMAVVFFATQAAFYGHPLASGYVRPQIDGSAGLISAGPQNIPLLKALTLPFGFHPRVMLHNFKDYFFGLFGIWTVLWILGFILLLLTKKIKISNPPAGGQYPIFNIKYLILFVLFSLFLLIFYGSWMFSDNLLKVPSIGTSYVRYFLPIYVFSLPLVASVIVWLWQRSRILKIGAAVLVLVLFLSSVAEVFAPLEGLSAVKTTIQGYQVWQEEVYARTESEAVIITRHADKYLFPGRKVIPGWQEPEQVQAIGNLVKEGKSVYLYDLKLDSSAEKDLSQRLSAVSVKLSAPIAGWENLELRRIKIKD